MSSRELHTGAFFRPECSIFAPQLSNITDNAQSKVECSHASDQSQDKHICQPPLQDDEYIKWQKWLSVNIDSHKVVDDDYGLLKIARHLGKEKAVELYWQGVQKEGNNDVSGAIASYKHSYRLWPALDSITLGGLPQAVRQEAKSVEGSIFEEILMDVIEVPEARASRVMHCASLLNSMDLHSINMVRDKILEQEDLRVNNPQNATHTGKVCVFMNNFPACPIYHQAPAVVGKMLAFAQRAWEEGNWGGTKDDPGPLHAITGGVSSLSIRVVEYWTYGEGGGLQDDYHYDTDSVLTIVCLLSDADDYDGGCFRTHESDGTQLKHAMQKGDTICFISHKYHNVTPVIRGTRRSLVMELWQGGVGQMGR